MVPVFDVGSVFSWPCALATEQKMSTAKTNSRAFIAFTANYLLNGVEDRPVRGLNVARKASQLADCVESYRPRWGFQTPSTSVMHSVPILRLSLAKRVETDPRYNGNV